LYVHKEKGRHRDTQDGERDLKRRREREKDSVKPLFISSKAFEI